MDINKESHYDSEQKYEDSKYSSDNSDNLNGSTDEKPRENDEVESLIEEDDDSSALKEEAYNEGKPFAHSTDSLTVSHCLHCGLSLARSHTNPIGTI